MTPAFSRRALLAGTASLGLSAFSCGASVERPPLPAKVVAGYWPTWVPDAIRVRDLPAEYNVVHLFAATPRGTSGDVAWQPPGDGRGARTNLRTDIAFARRSQGRAVLLSVGGAGHGITFDSRATSTRFVDGLRRIIDTELGGVDGVDLNTFEDKHRPNLDEYSWISEGLKSAYGEAFAVCAPPAPWRDTDRAFCRDMAGAGLLDLCGPQYYDDPGLTSTQYIVDSVGEWAGLVGATRLYVGFGIISGPPLYMTVERCADAWCRVQQAVPGVRGAFCWNTAADDAGGWRFASEVGRLVLT